MTPSSVAGRALSLLACGSLLACASVDVIRLDEHHRRAVSRTAIEVFLDEPTRPYTPIAIVQVDDRGLDLSLETLKAEMAKAAAAQGGDAVIIGQQSRRTAGAVFVPIGSTWHGVPYTRKTLAGRVVVFADK
jgi:hypothetical protein